MDTVRLNFEFPAEVYPLLKMILAQKRMSLREFAADLLVRAIEEEENSRLAQQAEKRLEALDEADLISWDEATKLAGWSDEEIPTPVRKKIRQGTRKGTRQGAQGAKRESRTTS